MKVIFRVLENLEVRDDFWGSFCQFWIFYSLDYFGIYILIYSLHLSIPTRHNLLVIVGSDHSNNDISLSSLQLRL